MFSNSRGAAVTMVLSLAQLATAWTWTSVRSAVEKFAETEDARTSGEDSRASVRKVRDIYGITQTSLGIIWLQRGLDGGASSALRHGRYRARGISQL
jgi:hypothetical protein